MYPSGRWRGYWQHPQWGRQSMHDLVLNFADGLVEGSGTDVVGPFTFQGTYDEAGHVALVKQYIGRHRVAYHGQYDGEGTIFGEWFIPPVTRDEFALRPEHVEVAADTAIITIAAPAPTPHQR